MTPLPSVARRTWSSRTLDASWKAWHDWPPSSTLHQQAAQVFDQAIFDLIPDLALDLELEAPYDDASR